MQFLKKSILYFSLFLLVGIIITYGLSAYIKKDTTSRIYNTISEVPKTKTLIILGASVHTDGRLSPILKDRVDTAIDLFRKNKAQQILISGDHILDNYNEVKAISDYLIENNIPKRKLLLDHSGLNTYDSMYRAYHVFGITDAIVVTQDFHLPRAIFISKHLGLNYYGFEAYENEFKIENENRVTKREKLANYKAVFEVVFNIKPKITKLSLGIPKSNL
ncbi:SanA/YdcF family protein [Zunongwangia sp.]|uniref:SanA/YdcF family protein n=1 Tax=Zunongwangia sp. TaxID=1965325 RepID=UPI003AA82574